VEFRVGGRLVGHFKERQENVVQHFLNKIKNEKGK
jgi:hypothetical protein